MPSDAVTFDRPKLERLKQAYTAAVERGEDTFDFEGDPFLVSYAKYVIEYLETVLNAPKP